MAINAVSLFAGGGGLDLGFSAAGFNIVYSTDIDHHSCETLKLNQNRREFYSEHLVEQKDINSLNTDDVLKKIELSKKDIDFVIGGPPCQAFSVFGKRKGLEDPRGNLVYEYARIINELKPAGFLFENVSGLKTIHGGALYNNLIETLSFGGEYLVTAHEYDVANFGVPQFRSRIIIIGTRMGSPIAKMETTHTSPNTLFNAHKPYNTVKQVFKNMPIPGGENTLFNHTGREHSQRIIDRYRSLEFGERDSLTRINKLNPIRPSYTIIVGSDKGGGKGHVHPYYPREVTPRESARLQSFPDWWEFYGNGRHVIRQVGNAVPPLFGAQLANHIKKELFNSKEHHSYDEFVKILGLAFLEDDN
jgi:DNA (cytosine-5)-methyltransferase 1